MPDTSDKANKDEANFIAMIGFHILKFHRMHILSPMTGTRCNLIQNEKTKTADCNDGAFAPMAGNVTADGQATPV
jgi:hypothetical protein